MIAKEVWFWLIIIGIIVLAVGIIILVFTSNNTTLGYLIVAGGIIVLLVGIVYAILKKTRRPLDYAEEDIKLRKDLSNTLSDTIEEYNKNVDKQMRDYIGGEYERRVRENVASQGRITGALGGAVVKWAAPY